MRFEQPLLEGTLLKRERRFQAEVRLPNGEEITAHCANPGSLLGCADPGNKVLISKNDNPRIKFEHQLEVIYAGRTPVGVHMARPLAVVNEAIAQGQLEQLAGYAQMRRLNRSPKNAYADLVLEGNGLRPCYIHVQSVTLAQEKIAYYPDTSVPDAVEVMDALTNLVREGSRAMIFFVAQRKDVEWFRPAEHIDAEYTQAFRDAVARGVEPICYRAHVTKKGIELDSELTVDLGEVKK